MLFIRKILCTTYVIVFVTLFTSPINVANSFLIQSSSRKSLLPKSYLETTNPSKVETADENIIDRIRPDLHREVLQDGLPAEFPKDGIIIVDTELAVTDNTIPSIYESDEVEDMLDASKITTFLLRAMAIGSLTGLGVGVFKSSIFLVSAFFFETLADILPKPVFYWPMALYPFLGSIVVAILTYFRGQSIRSGIDFIAKSVDYPPQLPFNITTISTFANNNGPSNEFNPFNQLFRLAASVNTLGSGCSLGPEGPSVELGAGISRMLCGSQATSRQRHHLFLAGTAAGVAAGFGAPIAGVFFAIECGNRYLSRNTVVLTETSPDGPRADIAAIVLAATMANIFVSMGHPPIVESLLIQGNSFAMSSPLFELPMYLGLGLFSGIISVCFNKLRDIFIELFEGKTWGKELPFASIPKYIQPILGGVLCGVVAVFYPQTLFAGYNNLDQFLAGGTVKLSFSLMVELLSLKLILSSFSLGTGLVGGVFAPSLFFGALTGSIYHLFAVGFVAHAVSIMTTIFGSNVGDMTSHFMTLANAPAYATVGAAATLGALFRAPLTSSMLMFEITQNHDIVLPVLASTGLGGLFAEVISHPRRQW